MSAGLRRPPVSLLKPAQWEYSVDNVGERKHAASQGDTRKIAEEPRDWQGHVLKQRQWTRINVIHSRCALMRCFSPQQLEGLIKKTGRCLCCLWFSVLMNKIFQTLQSGKLADHCKKVAKTWHRKVRAAVRLDIYGRLCLRPWPAIHSSSHCCLWREKLLRELITTYVRSAVSKERHFQVWLLFQ